MNSGNYLSLFLLCKLLLLIAAQDGNLPDSINEVDCLTMQMSAPHICCEPDTGNFCNRQCNNGICACVNPFTGEPTSDLRFDEFQESVVDCTFVMTPNTTTEATTTEATTTEATTTEATTTEDGTTTMQDFTTTSPVVEETTTEEITEMPTTDEEGSDSSESSESSDSSDSSDSEETSFSDSRSPDTRTGRTGFTKTNDTKSRDTKSSSRCPSVRKLLAKGCIQSCVLEGSDGCPACNHTCLDEAQAPTNVSCNCTEDQVCLKVGRFGTLTCVDLLAEGERCDDGRNDDDDDDDEKSRSTKSDDDSESSTSSFDRSKSYSRSARRRVGGARDRYIYGELNDAAVGCQEGLVCVRVDGGKSECQPENTNGTCTVASEGGVDYNCAPDGSFEPLQCQPDIESTLRCVCVNPSNGDPISGTDVTVNSIDEAPDCDKLVGCTVIRAGQTFDVDHGDYFVDVDNCQRCLCNNGEATQCEPSLCTALQRAPPVCVYQGQSYSHGQSFYVDCNLCGCRNGELRCTRRKCEERKLTDRCQECLSAPQEQVCGINGVTYPSGCVATYCAGLAPFDFFNGSCPSVDVCALYPCEEGEICLRKGGATCFDANGCDPDDIRLCVNQDSLMCEDTILLEGEDTVDTSSAVCGTNGVTYPDLCRLLQDTGNEAVAYAGECDREECQGGPVCGTDGVTYENICVLRAQSANARVDYYGECEAGPGVTPEGFCVRVSRARRCIYNISNCRHLVRPEEGCCALCGGILFVAIDFAGLRDYVRINPRVRTLDNIIEVLVDSGFIEEEETERCELEASLTKTGNIQITLSARDDADSEFCNNASKRLAAAINDPSSVSDISLFAQIPEVLQFASAAVIAPNEAAAIVDQVDVNVGVNGAPVFTALSYVTILLLASYTLVLL